MCVRWLENTTKGEWFFESVMCTVHWINDDGKTKYKKLIIRSINFDIYSVNEIIPSVYNVHVFSASVLKSNFFSHFHVEAKRIFRRTEKFFNFNKQTAFLFHPTALFWLFRYSFFLVSLSRPPFVHPFRSTLLLIFVILPPVFACSCPFCLWRQFFAIHSE